MIRNYRAWFEGKPEPATFPIPAASPESAAADYVRNDKETEARDIESAPAIVLVREENSTREAPHRIAVTASIDVTIWGYPEDAA